MMNLSLIFLCFVSCAGVQKTPIDNNQLRALENEKHRYIVITTDNSRFDFRKYRMDSDTLVIEYDRTMDNKPNEIKLQVNQIKKMYKIEYPNKLKRLLIFISPAIIIIILFRLWSHGEPWTM
jgi:hypothetical protein